jgi:outer membrane protein OmpA-like peptidoglycan-associated protein
MSRFVSPLSRSSFSRTSLWRSSVGRSSWAVCAVLLVGVTPAISQSAGGPTPAELIEALKSKATRGVKPAMTPEQLVADKKAAQLIEALKLKATRGLSASVEERKQLESVVSTKPAANLDIPFEFNSATISEAAQPALNALGKALQDGQLSGADLLVAGHTDAKGRTQYNQDLSQRRAQSVREFLIKNFSIPADKLIPVGYGREQLKNPDMPFADENRRVQVVNLTK